MAVVIWAIMKVEDKPESCCHFFPFLDCEKSLFFSRRSSPGARFSKVPIINVPAKLLLFSSKIEVSIAWHLTLAISWGNKMQ